MVNGSVLHRSLFKCLHALSLEKALSELHHRAHVFLSLKITPGTHIILLPAVKRKSNNSAYRPGKKNIPLRVCHTVCGVKSTLEMRKDIKWKKRRLQEKTWCILGYYSIDILNNAFKIHYFDWLNQNAF